MGLQVSRQPEDDGLVVDLAELRVLQHQAEAAAYPAHLLGARKVGVYAALSKSSPLHSYGLPSTFTVRASSPMPTPFPSGDSVPPPFTSTSWGRS